MPRRPRGVPTRSSFQYAPLPNDTVDGFIVNYISASDAGDFNKATVDGERARSFVIVGLEPDTIYDIKMQTFTSTATSEHSSVMHQKTARK